MLQQVLIVEVWPCEEVSVFYFLQESSWSGAEAASMKILNQLCFFLSLVMIAWAQCFNGIDIHMYHKPSVLFLCPFKTRVLFFRILISFLSNMDTQSLSHSWPEDISKAQCNPPKNCALFAWMLRLLDSGMLPVFVTFIVALFGNWTVGPYLVSLMLANNDIYSVYQ